MSKRKKAELAENWGYVPEPAHAEALAADCVRQYGASAIDDLPVDLDVSAFPYRAAAMILKGNRKYVSLDGLLLALSQGSHGSCFVAGTMVTMADGTEKPIQEVCVGESVISHTGQARKVIDSFSRQYTGTIVSTQVKGWPFPVEATEDHKFITFPGLPYGRNQEFHCPYYDNETMAWRPIGSLENRNRLLLTKPCLSTKEMTLTVEGVKHEVDDDLAWLLGLYLAEGCCELWHGKTPSRITLTMHVKERLFIERAAKIFKEKFRVNPIIKVYPSRPNTIKLRVCGKGLTAAFMGLMPGKALTKSVPAGVLQCPESVRWAFFRGWFTGDGYSRSRKGAPEVVIVSASSSLMRGMWRIATSLGLQASISRRAAYKQSKESFSLCLHGDSALQVDPTLEDSNSERTLAVATKARCQVKYGLAQPIQKIERKTETTTVYCLEVEEEHSFIANGYAVHNCIGWGEARKILITLACGIYLRGLEIEWPTDNAGNLVSISPSWCYAAARQAVNNLGKWEGASGSGAAKATESMGFCWELDYGDVDLSKYSTADCDKWEASGVPKASLAHADDNLLKGRFRVETWQQVAALAQNGYAFNFCGMDKPVSNTRDADGVIRGNGRRWSHSQAGGICYIAKKIKPGKWFRAIGILNSHGNKRYSGGKHPLCPDLPDGAYLQSVEDIQRGLDRRDSWCNFELEGLRPASRKWKELRIA